jgi:hypothetical protein
MQTVSNLSGSGYTSQGSKNFDVMNSTSLLFLLVIYFQVKQKGCKH